MISVWLSGIGGVIFLVTGLGGLLSGSDRVTNILFFEGIVFVGFALFMRCRRAFSETAERVQSEAANPSFPAAAVQVAGEEGG